jgi:hypothetical protein
VVLGVLTSYTIGVIYTEANIKGDLFWRLQFMFPLIPNIIQTVFLLTGYIPESPVSFLKKERFEDAREIYALFN